jgi:hypothetical protein
MLLLNWKVELGQESMAKKFESGDKSSLDHRKSLMTVIKNCLVSVNW